MKRTITKSEEQAIRLCHHDHGGKSIEEAAKILDCTVDNVKKQLRNARKKAPQLFPILTPRHRAILTMYDQHLSRAAIMEGLGISEKVLEREVTFLRAHGRLFNRVPDQYRASMDGDVKEVF